MHYHQHKKKIGLWWLEFNNFKVYLFSAHSVSLKFYTITSRGFSHCVRYRNLNKLTLVVEDPFQLNLGTFGVHTWFSVCGSKVPFVD